MPSPPRYRKGDKIGGQYLVHQALQGGMGEVYLCLDLKHNVPYALKTFQQRYHFDPQSRELFNEEVSTWIALEKHPNIVRCFWMQKLDNQPFMGLEWVAGEEGRGTDLRGWLRRGPLDLRLALDFTMDICRGLLYANQKQPGIVHRDLKPDNILVSQGRLAKITDFGLAMVAQRANLALADDDAADDLMTHPQTRRAGGAVGTPPYMPPEQWQGETVDARADIYAVGCILYELLTGQFPYTATTLSGFRRQHEQAPIPTLPPDSGLPPALNDLLAGCLAKQPDERFPDVGSLLEAVTTLYRQQVGEEPRPQPEAGAFTAGDHINRGTTYANLERYEQALTDFNYAIELDPDYTVYFNRGRIYDEMKRYDEALEDYTKATTLNPTFTPAYINIGLIYYSGQRYEDALKEFDRAIKIEPSNVNAYYERGNVYNCLQEHEEALKNYTMAIELNPSFVLAYINRSESYRAIQLYDKAIADLNQAIQLNPSSAMAYSNRGMILAVLGQHKEAQADFIRVFELEPTYTDAYMNMGNLFIRQGRLQKAIAYFEKANELGEKMGLEYAEQARKQTGLQALMHSMTLDELQQATIRLPFMVERNFLEFADEFIKENVLPEARPAIEERLEGLWFIMLQRNASIVAQQTGYEWFKQAGSLEEMELAVRLCPSMTTPGFIAFVEQAIAQQVPPEHKPAAEQRLDWLRQIANEQQ